MTPTRARLHRTLRALLLPVLLLAAGSACAKERPKVVVIGFDGGDPKLVEHYRAQGLMPNLDHIAGEGA